MQSSDCTPSSHIQETRFSGYDLVGDIHGCYDSLIHLLDELGYVKQAGVYQYRNQRRPRQLIFLGDILDRGPKIREAVLLVQELVTAGTAMLVMGNHEYSALGYTTPAPSGSNKRYLREHTPSNQRVIQETLEQFSPYPQDWRDTLAWLYEWPLLLEFEHFRVVHACWDHALIAEFLRQRPGACIDESFLLQSVNYREFAARFMARITRGASLLLPDNQSMTASDGYTRNSFRIKFWVENPKTYGDLLFQPDPLDAGLAKRPLNEEEKSRIPYYDPSQKPLFIGHYWQQGKVKPVVNNIACLDYSAVKNGRLVAYRMDQEKQLMTDKFAWVRAQESLPYE